MERRTADVIGQKVFAVAEWSPIDVMSSHYGKGLTEEEAEAFLIENEAIIQERMIQAGWEAIDACLLYNQTWKRG